MTNFFLELISLVYKFLLNCRLFLYRINLLKAKELACPVICVGNLTLGGTGKTPLCLLLASFLKKKGIRVVIISRGYKGTLSRKIPVSIVSEGDKALFTPEESGDEPYLLAKKLKDIPILIGIDRYKAGRVAEERFNPQVIILDDGFQHLSLARKLNILLLDAREPFGNGYLFPRGTLRESSKAIKRADLIMLNQGVANSISASFEEEVSPLTQKDIPLFHCFYRPMGLREFSSGKEYRLDFLQGKRCFSFCGIGNPEGFKKLLLSSGARLEKFLCFADHHQYSRKDLQRIEKESGENFVLTTEKDAVRLEQYLPLSFPLFILEIKLSIREGEENFGEYILGRIN